jgi:hypothetical protein
VHAPPQRVFHGPQFLAEPLGHRLAPDRALSVPRVTTEMRKAEKVEPDFDTSYRSSENELEMQNWCP